MVLSPNQNSCRLAFGRRHPAAVQPQRTNCVPCSPHTAAGSLCQNQIQPVRRHLFHAPAYGGMIRYRFVGPWRPHLTHAAFRIAIRIVVGHHPKTGKVQLFFVVLRRATAVTALWAWTPVLLYDLYERLQMFSLAPLPSCSAANTFPVCCLAVTLERRSLSLRVCMYYTVYGKIP